jgi:transposase
MIRLTDEQWERIRDHFPEENIADGRPGRKPTPTRCVLEAVLWILNTGAQWHMLPQSYPNYKTVHRRFQTWCRDEVLRRVLTDVANELRDRGALNEEECFIDATFVMAKGGGLEIGATKRGKGMKIMAIVDRHGLPLSVSTHAANHHEVRLVQLCFDFYMIEAMPENLIGDRAYDSDPLDAELRKDGIEMIARRPKDTELRERLRALAHERRRFGYRRLHVLLRREGFIVNHKRLFRIYREERLMVRRGWLGPAWACDQAARHRIAFKVDRNHRDARRGALCRLMADRLNLFARASIATMLGRPSTEKEASVTVASPRSAASLAVEIVMSSAVSDKRSEVAALRATTSSAARTRTLAVSFTLTAYSGMGQALA